jgi:hypothetical protein
VAGSFCGKTLAFPSFCPAEIAAAAVSIAGISTLKRLVGSTGKGRCRASLPVLISEISFGISDDKGVSDTNPRESSIGPTHEPSPEATIPDFLSTSRPQNYDLSASFVSLHAAMRLDDLVLVESHAIWTCRVPVGV